MSYGQWKINEELTFKEFGYYSHQLTKGTKSSVKCECEECGIIANKRFMYATSKHRCKSIIDGLKKCFKCKEFKNVDLFSKNKSTFDGYQKVCKSCFANYESVKRGYAKKTYYYKNSIKHYFNLKFYSLKGKVKLTNVEFDLKKDDMFEIYEKQNGKCYYTNIEMIHNIGKFDYNSISIDRLDPSKGYVKNNVVLCLFNVNSFKGGMSEIEFKEFLELAIPSLINFKNKK